MRLVLPFRTPEAEHTFRMYETDILFARMLTAWLARLNSIKKWWQNDARL